MADEKHHTTAGSLSENRFRTALESVPLLVQLLSLLTGVLGIVVPGLGYLAQEKRVLMLSLPREALEYGPYQATLTGFSVCWHLLWQMAYAVTSGANWMAGISLAFLAVVLFRRAIFPSHRSSLGSLALLLLLLIPGALVSLGYSQVITIARNGLPPPPGRRGFTILERAQFQTRSWIEHPAPDTIAQAVALAGVAGWLTLYAVTMTMESRRLAAHHRGASRACMHICGGAFAVLSVFLGGQIPTAYAYAQWGLTYPSVAGVAAKCDADLAKSIKGGSAEAWDISIGAKYEYLLVRSKESVPEKWFVQPLIRPGGGRCSSLAAGKVIPPETTQ